MQPRQRLDHVDGLRGIAALVVVVQHACQLVQDAGVGHYRPLLEFINLGRFGVVLFFLISGLVIPFSIRGERPLRDFAIGRAFRLFPVYWLSIPALGGLLILRGGSIDLATLLSNLTMLQGLWGGWNIGPGYWTLTYEMSFYIVAALLYALGKLSNVTLNAVAVLVCLALSLLPLAAALWMGGTVAETRAPYFVAMFALGVLLNRTFVDHSAAARRWAMLLVPLAMIVGVVGSGWFVPTPENANVYLRPLALSTGAVLPVAVFVLVLWLKPRAGAGVRYLAKISYSLYLFQDIALLLLPFVLPPGTWPIVYVLAVIAVTAAIASLAYRFVEQPMIAVGRTLAGRGRRAGKSSQPA